MLQELLFHAVRTALDAAREILDLRNNPGEIKLKEDQSPVTMADLASQRLIINSLKKTGLPIISEEQKNVPYAERQTWKRVWIVDPLDGTREFLSGNGEYTVNIALADHGHPLMGVICVPEKDLLYFGMRDAGSWRISGALKKKLATADHDTLMESAEPLPVSGSPRPYRITASRSHMDADTLAFINELLEIKAPAELSERGSSMKFCALAEGSADLYPRFGPCMEWDTAAGHAILAAVGGYCRTADEDRELSYNKENLLNPNFIAGRAL